MRKFIIKHRQKRKYTRKTEKISSYSFSKTLSGMLPLVVMGISLMATVIISTPFRNTFSHLQFTFQFPEISFDNPLIFIQTVTAASIQIGETIGMSLLAIFATLQHTFIFTRETTAHAATLLDPRPLFLLLINGITLLRDVLSNSILFIVHNLLNLFSLSVHASDAIILGIIRASNAFFSDIFISVEKFVQIIVSVLTLFSSLCSNILISIGDTIISLSISTAHVLLSVYLVIAHFIGIILTSIWIGVIFIINTITTTILNAITTIVHIIEIPFKTLYFFWLKIKPYVDILDRHIAMTGADLNNGFASWGKVASLLGPSK